MSFNKLPNSEIELLVLLSEECAEVIKAVSKILRHGYESKHPNAPPTQTNRVDLENEIGDVRAAVELLCHSGGVVASNIFKAEDAKMISIARYLHHQNPNNPHPHTLPSKKP